MTLHRKRHRGTASHSHLVGCLIVVLTILADAIDTPFLIVIEFCELRIKLRLHGLFVIVLRVERFLIHFLIDIPRLIHIDIMSIGKGCRST